MGSVLQRSRIRVVLADSDVARRETIMFALLSAQMFDMVAVATTAEQCQEVMEETLPELIVTSHDLLRVSQHEEQEFPLYVVLGTDENSSPRVIGAISDLTNTQSINAVLGAAASTILTAKAAELSKLIEHYMEFGRVDDLRETLEVEAKGDRHDLHLNDIQWIETAGNYVCIHAASGTYDAREPLTRLAARLQRSGFLRVHRRIVVNTSAIIARLTEGRSVVALQLSGGTKVPVGPMFQGSVPDNSPRVDLRSQRE